MSEEVGTYESSISLLQQAGPALGIAESTISNLLWLFSSFYASSQPSSATANALACLVVLEKDLNQPELPGRSIQEICEYANSHRFGVVTAAEISDAVPTIYSFIERTQYQHPTLSPLNYTIKTISLLFGGRHWAKEVFSESIMGIAAGVINDMYRSPTCTTYHPNHWVFTAIHYSFCAYFAENIQPTKSVEISWKRWIQSGIRWWINFETDPDTPKFDLIPVMEHLLTYVYTHITTENPIRRLLLHPSLRLTLIPSPPAFSSHTELYPSKKLSDGVTCEEFKLEILEKGPLASAIKNLNLLEIRYLIEEKKLDWKQYCFDGSSMFYIAAENNKVDVLEYLVNIAVQHSESVLSLLNTPKCTGATPLHVASFLGYKDVVLFLLAQGVEVNTFSLINRNTPLYDAINHKHLEIAMLLLQHNADGDTLCINGSTAIHAASHVNAPLLIDHLYQSNSSQLESRKAPHGETPLHIAINSGNIDATKRLLELGSPIFPDFRFGAFSYESFYGITGWHSATFTKNANILQVLLDSGAFPDPSIQQVKEFNRLYQLLVRPTVPIDIPPTGLPYASTDDSLHKRARIE